MFFLQCLTGRKRFHVSTSFTRTCEIQCTQSLNRWIETHPSHGSSMFFWSSGLPLSHVFAPINVWHCSMVSYCGQNRAPGCDYWKPWDTVKKWVILGCLPSHNWCRISSIHSIFLGYRGYTTSLDLLWLCIPSYAGTNLSFTDLVPPNYNLL